MKKIYDYPTTWSYQGHIQAGSNTPGIDFGLNFNEYPPVEAGTVTFVGEDPDSINPRNNSKAKYIVVRGNSGDHYYVHNSEQYVRSGQYVSTDTIIAKSGDTGNTSGPHLHYALKKNGLYTDPTTFLNHLKGINVNNQNMSDFITVQAGWGLSHVAKAAGYPDYGTVAAWERIYNLNPGFRGATNWQELNARIGVNDQLRVQIPTNQGTQEPSKEENNTKVAELEAELKATKEKLLNELLQEKAEKERIIKELEQKVQNEAQNRAEIALKEELIQKLSIEVSELNKRLKIDFNLDFEASDLILDFAADVAQTEGKTLIEKIKNSRTFQSLTKYDWMYILFSGIGLLSVFPDNPEIWAGIPVVGVAAKNILTRLLPLAKVLSDWIEKKGDRTGDNKFTKEDTDYLKNF